MTLLAPAAGLAALLLIGVALLQLALASGAPWGAYAWGGEHTGTLPQRLRIGSALSAPLLLFMALVVLVRGRLIWPEAAGEMDWAVWLIALFMVINTAANRRSKSAEERRVMGPLTALIAILLVVVQLNQPPV